MFSAISIKGSRIFFSSSPVQSSIFTRSCFFPFNICLTCKSSAQRPYHIVKAHLAINRIHYQLQHCILSANMVKLQEPIPLFAVVIALIPLSSSGSFVTVTEDEAVQLEFPYPCDSNIMTIQIANRLPFYSSTDTANIHMPNYQLHRFSVTDKNCSVHVDINPVKRSDEATYISKAYRNGVIQSRFTKIRLNVNYPPGDASCAWNINDGAVGDWVPLQCTAPIGSLAGGINCYQDYKQLPPMSKPFQNGTTLKQTIWARKKHPVFCCSSILNRPKDRCECKDFVWDSMEDISQTNKNIDPCSAITPVRVLTLPQYHEREYEDNPKLPEVIESLNPTDTYKDKSTANITAKIWVVVISIIMLEIAAGIISISLYVAEKKKSN